MFYLLKFTTFYVYSDGQMEQMNAWLEQYLRPWTATQPTGWSKILPIAEFAHNLWRHDITRKSPHELLFGMKLQVILKHLKSPMPAAEVHLKLLDKARQTAQKLLAHIQNCKDDRKIMEMKEGDQVWLEGHNLSITGNKKLSPKQYGPFPISEENRGCSLLATTPGINENTQCLPCGPSPPI